MTTFFGILEKVGNDKKGEMMRCLRCLNEDPSWFYKGSRGWYCRRCIGFGRALIEEEKQSIHLESICEDASAYTLKYPLTKAQKIIASKILRHIDTTDVLCKAVCGAGKTEIVIPTIAQYLSFGKKVCFAIARRQVVLEVSTRLQSYFTNASVIGVCGGHTQVVDGDLIVCTTHQLYRYYQAFDLLILDEPDAFPFKGDVVLHGIAQTSCKGHIIYLTATPDTTLQKRIEEGSLRCFSLNQRPHGKPIPVPQIITLPKVLNIVWMLLWLKQHASKPRIVFVPTIRQAKMMSKLIQWLEPCYMVNSKSEGRDSIIEAFRKEEHAIIVATTVLERGVTIPHADVCVFEANHGVFDEAGLVQMAGRAGRDFLDPSGDVLFLCSEKSENADKCRQSLIEANATCIV